MSVKTLAEPIRKNGTADSDNDTLTDWQETDGKAVEIMMDTVYADGDIIEVPTFGQYMGYADIFSGTVFKRISPYYIEAISEIPILPILSDPMKEDSDGDWFLDSADNKILSGSLDKIENDLTSTQIAEFQDWLVTLGYLNMLDNAYGVSYGVLTRTAVNVYQLNHNLNLTENLDIRTYAKIANEYFNYCGNSDKDYNAIFSNVAESWSESINIIEPSLSQEYIDMGIEIKLLDNRTIKSDKNREGTAVPYIRLYLYDYTLKIKKRFKENSDEATKIAEERDLIRSLIWFYTKVNHGEEWDIKLENRWNEQLGKIIFYSSKFPFAFGEVIINAENLGNIMYGYCGTAMNISEDMLIFGSGYAANTSNMADTDDDKQYVSYGVSLYSNIPQ